MYDYYVKAEAIVIFIMDHFLYDLKDKDDVKFRAS